MIQHCYTFFLLFVFPCLAYGQVSPKDSTFFKEQLPDVKAWVSKLGMSNDTIKTRVASQNGRNYNILYFQISSGKDWGQASVRYTEQSDGGSLERDLLDKWRFLCDTPLEETVLHVQTLQNNVLIAGYENKQFAIEYYIFEGNILKRDSTKAFLQENPTKTPLIFQLLPRKTAKVRTPDIEKYKKTLYEHIKYFYKDDGTDICGKAKCVRHEKDEAHNTLEVEVTNLSREVLEDFMFGPYERIGLSFEIFFEDGCAYSLCTLNAQYATGFICYTPQNYAYKGIEGTYNGYVEPYLKKVIALHDKKMRKCEEK